jgi:anti-sigma regulatory factor (Ser/Thr protein kinase)
MHTITDTITVPGQPHELRHLHAFLGDFWQRHALPAGDAMRMELGLEEVFINVVTHGLASADMVDAPVTVDLCLADGSLELVVEDPGPAFDPLATAPVDTTTGMDTRLMGGLGIHLVRTMLDDVRYERIDGRNRLVMVARLRHPHRD